MTIESGGYTGGGKFTPFPVQSGCVIPKHAIEKLGVLPSATKLQKASFDLSKTLEKIQTEHPMNKVIDEAVSKWVAKETREEELRALAAIAISSLAQSMAANAVSALTSDDRQQVTDMIASMTPLEFLKVASLVRSATIEARFPEKPDTGYTIEPKDS